MDFRPGADFTGSNENTFLYVHIINGGRHENHAQ